LVSIRSGKRASVQVREQFAPALEVAVEEVLQRKSMTEMDG
jgi:hypothetical protein